VNSDFGRERRKRKRFAVRCRVVFFRESSGVVADCVTQNVSCIGLYCASPIPLEIGEVLTCLLMMPSDGARDGSSLTLECRVRVVRVERIGEEASFGIACQIEDYRANSSQFASEAQGGLLQ
jgi:hypothetical protein